MEGQSSTSSNRPRMIYDVFISFRGEETRNTFVGFLYKALHRLGIITFLDDKKFLIGDNLSEELVRAIQESRSSIVVLSNDYASSKWCLKELTRIIDCMAETNHRVLPVFYHVDPSDVRHQSGSFKQSFNKHEEMAQKLIGAQKKKCLEEIQNWKDAMTKIGHLSGEVVTKHSPEVGIVDKITKQIFERWRPKLVTSNDNLVGMTYRLLQMNVQLGLGLDDIRFVVIHGMGGIGKTTIAQIVYECITSKFEDSCFLRIRRGSYKQSDLVSLQEQILFTLLKEKVRVRDEYYGAGMIENKLCSRKVLLVLDGVEEREQLEVLAKSPNWFGSGSRVIITTRNKDILRQPYKIFEYEVELLDSKSALQLFSKCAFGVDCISSNFMNLGKEIVEKLGRLPLALKVIGSYLDKREEVIWKETLNRLIKVDEKQFFEVLKISYDGLGVESQKVFLDLACLFHGKKKDKVIKILECFGYSPYTEIQLLKERCLLEDSPTKILMHDLVVALGQEIVRRESLTKPGKQSRIWLHEDVDHVFTVKHGLKYTEGIVLNLKKETELILEAKSFTYMTCLRILEISNVQLFGNINFLSNLLGFLNWPGYSSKCLPSNFQSRHLLELHLPHSRIEILWEGKKAFEKLKVIDVSDSEYLLETPDFSKVPNLERLILRNCTKLYHIHSSINDLNHLILLDLSKCSSLESFSSYLRCKSLECLVFSKSGLTSSLQFWVNMEHLSYLHLDGTPIKQLHSSIECLVGLVLLDLKNCIMLSSLPSEIGNLKSLHTLLLEGCKSLHQIPSSLGNAQCLEYLDIGKTSICQLPPTIHYLKNLKRLNCEGLSRNIWHSLLPPRDIQRSDLEISSFGFGLKSLKHLSLKNCNLAEQDIPEDLHCFSSLHILDLSGNHFVQYPKSINHLVNLNQLMFHDCFKLQQIPKPSINLKPMFSSVGSGMPIQSLPYQLDKPFWLEYNSQITFKLDPKTYEEIILGGCMFDTPCNDKAEILECFDEKKEGNSVEVEYNQVKNDANVIYGVFISACFECSKNMSHDEDNTFYCNFSIELETDMNPASTKLLSWTFAATPRSRIWTLFIPSQMLPRSPSMQSSLSSFKATITYAESSIHLQKCGASILSHQNASEFLANMYNRMSFNHNKFRTVMVWDNHKSECSCDEPETVEHNYLTQSVEKENDSSSLLRRNLKSNLQRTYEDIKHICPCYFFPQNQVSSWFRIQQPNDTLKMKLPPNLVTEKKWMGLAMFAIFSAERKSEFAQSPPFVMNIRHSLISSNHETRSGDAYNILYLPLELLWSSPKILFVIFIPRKVFPDIQDHMSDHLYVKFLTNDMRLQVELCGARLVYQHNVEGFINTIMDCVLNSGQNQYQKDYKHNILGNLLETYHSPTLTSTSNFPTEKLPQERPPFQALYKLHTFIPGKEIPAFFSGRSMGNEATIRLPETINLIEYHVGVLVCAVVTTNKLIEEFKRIPESQSGIKVLDLICEFGVDSLKVVPENRFFFPAKQFLSLSTTSLIWLFSIPLEAFDAPLSCCKYFRTKVSSNEKLFDVEQCGLHLLRATEQKMLDDLLQ